jgi:hypothetical protein
MFFIYFCNSLFTLGSSTKYMSKDWFLSTYFIEDPNLLALKITPNLLKREFFSKIEAPVINISHRPYDSHDT